MRRVKSPTLTQPSKFVASHYRDVRPLYPRALFRDLERELKNSSPIFLDLGCGTGQSTRSFLNLGLTRVGFAVEPDPEMRSGFRHLFQGDESEVDLLSGRAEEIPLPDASVDLVLVGSAIHWFELARARSEIERVLKADGILFVFEYQFPKCIDDAALAETVRRRFNLEWKSPVQKPRGTLRELLLPFTESGAWGRFTEDRPEWIEVLSLEAFLGHLFSQSRFLHAESIAPDPVRYREEIAEYFTPLFLGRTLRFDLKPRAIGLRRLRASC